jgi:hypothetical protein
LVAIKTWSKHILYVDAEVQIYFVCGRRSPDKFLYVDAEVQIYFVCGRLSPDKFLYVDAYHLCLNARSLYKNMHHTLSLPKIFYTGHKYFTCKISRHHTLDWEWSKIFTMNFRHHWASLNNDLKALSCLHNFFYRQVG